MTESQYKQLAAHEFEANRDGIESGFFAAACCDSSIEELYDFDRNEIYIPDLGDIGVWAPAKIGVTDIRNAIEWQMYYYN